MEENPYQTPNSDVVIDKSVHDKINLKKLATGQKLVIYAVMLYFIAGVARKFFPPVTLLLIVVCFGMSLIGAFKVVKALEIHVFFKILYFGMLFIPIINILSLLSLNARATKMLKEGGYHVGLMGAKPLVPK